jgi:hypothetical protein
MRKPIILFVAYSALCAFDLYAFVGRSLERDWVWAGADWICTVASAVGAIFWLYRATVVYKWRHRHEHKA